MLSAPASETVLSYSNVDLNSSDNEDLFNNSEIDCKQKRFT